MLEAQESRPGESGAAILATRAGGPVSTIPATPAPWQPADKYRPGFWSWIATLPTMPERIRNGYIVRQAVRR